MFYTDVCAIGAGQLAASIHQKLTANGWTFIEDAAANRKIYSSAGSLENETIFLQINDTQANYLTLTVGTGYDPGAKTLLNPTTGKNLLKATAVSTPYWLSVTADRMILATRCNRVAPNFYDTAYAGLLRKYKAEHLNSQVVIGGASTDTAEGIRHRADLTQECGRICATHVDGKNAAVQAVSMNACFPANQLPNAVDGMMMMSPILVGISGAAIFGELDGCYSAQGAVVASEEQFSYGGRDFIVIISSTAAVAIEKK